MFVAESLDLPIVTQGATLDDLAANTSESVALFLDGEDPAEFGLVGEPIVVATLELQVAAKSCVTED